MKEYNKTITVVNEFLNTVILKKEKIGEKKSKLINQQENLKSELAELNKQYIKADLAEEEKKIADIEKKMAGIRSEILGIENLIKNYDDLLNNKDFFKEDATDILKIASRELVESITDLKAAGQNVESIKEKMKQIEKELLVAESMKARLSDVRDGLARTLEPISKYLFEVDLETKPYYERQSFIKKQIDECAEKHGF